MKAAAAVHQVAVKAAVVLLLNLPPVRVAVNLHLLSAVGAAVVIAAAVHRLNLPLALHHHLRAAVVRALRTYQLA